MRPITIRSEQKKQEINFTLFHMPLRNKIHINASRYIDTKAKLLIFTYSCKF